MSQLPITHDVAEFAPKVLIPIANGTQEIEAVTAISILNKAGAHVTVASVGTAKGELTVKCFRGTNLTADKTLDDCKTESFDMIVLAGGTGAEVFRDSKDLIHLLTIHSRERKYIAAICSASVTVLSHHQFLSNLSATTYPPLKHKLHNPSDARVVCDGHIITSEGPGAALEFAVILVDKLFGTAKAAQVAKESLLVETPSKVSA